MMSWQGILNMKSGSSIIVTSEIPEGESYPIFPSGLKQVGRKLNELMSRESVQTCGDCDSWGRDSLFIIEAWQRNGNFGSGRFLMERDLN